MKLDISLEGVVALVMLVHVDIIFVDPPFAHPELIGRCLALIRDRGWIRPGGWIYIEAHADQGAPELPVGWELYRSKVAGQVGYHLVKVPKAET